ncbi:MAG: tetratricopeptide repeat protein [Desulfovibrionaceae bacterium]|nr:tetratricopeptide repeat protein [Desulfovibrionaceae bacterium]
MTSENHNAKARALGPLRPVLLLVLLLTAALAASCASTSGQDGPTRIGGKTWPTGTVTGKDPSLLVYKNELFNGPSDVRIRHRQALTALGKGDYAEAAAVFEATLQSHPAHPDATYYLGLTRIYQGQREAGFELLKSYRDPNHFRITTWVRKMAAFLEEKEDVTPKVVHRTLNHYRTDAYNQERNDTRDMETRY